MTIISREGGLTMSHLIEEPAILVALLLAALGAAQRTSERTSEEARESVIVQAGSAAAAAAAVEDVAGRADSPTGDHRRGGRRADSSDTRTPGGPP